MRPSSILYTELATSVPHRYQLRWQLIVYFVALATIPLLSAMSFALFQMRSQSERQIINQLESVAELKQGQINQWLESNELVIDGFLADEDKHIQMAGLATSGTVDIPTQTIVNGDLRTLAAFHAHADASHFRKFFLYDRQGNVFASSVEADIGKVVVNQPYFTSSLKGPYLQPPYYAVGDASLTMLLTRPLRDLSGQMVGVLVGDVNLTELGQIMIARTGLGDSGETYLVSPESNYLLTPSRSHGYPVNRAYDSLGIDRALHGERGSAVYEDYRTPPVRVIGSYRWIPELNAALLAEIDEAEGQALFLRTAILSGTLTGLAALIAILVGLFVATRISRPITLLVQAATQITAGALDQRVVVAGRNEIGILATAFNRMTDRLHQTLAGLEQRVAERTLDLEQANAEAQHALADLRESLHARDLLTATVRESERLYRTLASNFPNGAVVLFDHDLRFTIADGAGLADIGLSPERLEGHTFWDIYPPEARRVNEPIFRAALAGTPNIREVAVGDLTLIIHTLPVRDEHGAIIAGMLMSQDITERKRMEKALIDERALLARRVDERTADLSAANAELARTARLKDEFLASMSHELRTPLNAVLGLSEALQEEVYGPLNDRQRRSLHSIEESGRHLLELINDILDLAKIGAGKLELELKPASIATICQASLRLIKQVSHTKRLSVELTLDPTVTLLHVDARRVKQILVNLLSNAVKFTPEGESIGLEVVGDAARQAVDLIVWDTGIGIAQEQMPRLFQPFVQLDSRLARQYEGTGLGLALVYRMVELHGGSISVTSNVSHGSRFTVTLPWHTPNVGAQAEPEVIAIDRATMHRALVCEDSPTTADQITRYLHELAIASDIVLDGAQVVARAITEQPDLILLDLLLADSSGWDVLAQLKAEPRTRAIPVVIISVIDERAHALALGAAEYLVKPIARIDLQRVLPMLAVVPRGSSIPPAPGAIGTPAAAISPSLVLLAEDNEATIAMIADYLGSRGYQVVVARNGAEAIAQAREARPAIVLMDIQMPGMDGLEATRRIRSIDALVDLPIIALTALAMPGDRERCLAAGATDYLSKPVSLRGLVILIETHLRQHSSQQRYLGDASDWQH
jgi:PAS domain S-box-containing protein